MVKSFTPLEAKYWGMLLLIGSFAGLGQYFVTKAYHYAPASEVSIYDYTGVILSPWIAYVLFGERLGWRTGVGMLFILLSGYVSYRHNISRARA